MSKPQDRPLSKEAYKEIERECAKYPKKQRQSGIMAALRIAQGHNQGWLSSELIEHVAEVIGVPSIRAYEVATFYNMYDLEKVGKHKLCICTNLPCALMGSVRAADKLKENLGIGFGETTTDGMHTLVEGECFGACGDAPVVIENNTKLHAKVTADRVEEFIAGLGKS